MSKSVHDIRWWDGCIDDKGAIYEYTYFIIASVAFKLEISFLIANAVEPVIPWRVSWLRDVIGTLRKFWPPSKE